MKTRRGVRRVLTRGQQEESSAPESPGGSSLRPHASGIDRLCVWSARGCQLSPGRGAGGGRRGQAGGGGIGCLGDGDVCGWGNASCFAPTPFFPSLAQNFFLAFQPRGGDIWKISAHRAKLRGWRSEEMGFAGSASDWRKKKKNAIKPCAGSQVSDFSTALFSSQFKLFAPWRFEVHSFRVLCFFFSVSELEVHLMV